MDRGDPSSQSEGARLFGAFLERNRIALATAGRQLGVSRVAVHHWVYDGKIPSEENQLAIETWTSGEVPRSVWPREKPRHVEPFRPEIKNPAESERSLDPVEAPIPPPSPSTAMFADTERCLMVVPPISAPASLGRIAAASAASFPDSDRSIPTAETPDSHG